MFARGVLLHPRHMWFISGAHTERDIAHTLSAANEAMIVAARSA
jgi:glutamate-1-semialdehyde 2,1-aminomutase